jgi:hypothetical protein
MASKTLIQILSEISAKILTGGRRTTAVNTRSVLTDLADSTLNKKDGGLVVEALTGYATELTPNDPRHFATVKYVDDNGGSVPDASTTVAGKSELIDDAELDAATPAANDATTPSYINKVLDLRNVTRLWKRVFSFFYTKTYTDDNFLDIYSSSAFVLANNSGSGNAYIGTNSKFSAGSPVIFYLGFSDSIGWLPTGTATLNLNGGGVLPLLAEDGTNLVPGQIVARVYPVISDDVAFYIQGVRSASGGGSGDVVGPASSTDNALARFDLLTGKLIQNSDATLDDAGNLTTADVTVSSATASTLVFFSAAKKLITATGALLGTFFQTLTAKPIPVDSDTIVVNDSAASFESKKTSLLQLKQFFGVESTNPLGNIITENFTNLSGWTARGGTIGTDYTVSGNVLTLTGNGTNLGRAIKSNFGVCMYDRYRLNYTLICDTTPSATTIGVGVGMRAPTTFTGSVHNLYVRVGMDTAVGNKGYIFYSYDFDNSLIFDQYKSEVKFTDVLLGDEFRATTQVVANAVFTKMDRYSGGVYVETREFFKYFPSNVPPKFPYLPSPWEFTINIHGTGTQKVRDYSVDVLDSKEADYMLISTSIGKGSSIGTGRMLDRAARQWADLTGKRITVYAAANAKLDGLDVNKIKGQPYSLNPTVIILDLVINDLIQNGNATTITNFTTKVNALVTAGYVVGTTLFFLEVTPSNSFDVSTFNTHLYTTYPFNSIIKIYGAAKVPGGTGILSTMSFDGLHPNKTLESIKAMALANHFGNAIINRPVFYDTASSFSLQPILDIPATDYAFTGIPTTYTVQSLQYVIPAGTIKAGDKLFLDITMASLGTSTKNVQAFIVPTPVTASSATNIIGTRTISAATQRLAFYREIYIRATSGAANCFVQAAAPSSLHPYQDTALSDLTIDWAVDNYFMIQMNAVTSTDTIFIKAVSLNIFRK